MKGTLKGYDALMNLVLDDVEEKLTGNVSLHSTNSFTNSQILQMTKEKKHGDHWVWWLLEELYSSE